jgi:hypothetical protein
MQSKFEKKHQWQLSIHLMSWERIIEEMGDLKRW